MAMQWMLRRTNSGHALASLSTSMNDSSANAPTQFDIHRSHSQPGYVIRSEAGHWFHVKVDRNNLTRKVIVRNLDKGSVAVAVSHMPWPWASRIIHIGYADPDTPHAEHWEVLEKVKKLPWEDLGREEYRWTIGLPEDESSAQLLWIVKTTEGIRPWGIGDRSYTLTEMRRNEVLAEFTSKGSVCAGGMLQVKNAWRQRSAVPAIQLLVTFLAIYELGSSKTCCSVYSPIKTEN